jgi:hypothetical protein
MKPKSEKPDEWKHGNVPEREPGNVPPGQEPEFPEKEPAEEKPDEK